MPGRVLPVRPDLNQYKKQAKDLVKACTASVPEALERIRLHHPRLRGVADIDIHCASFKLADAQLVIAREHAFESWPRFSRHVDSRTPRSQYERIPVDRIELSANVTGREGAAGVVLFPHASGSARLHPANCYIAHELQRGSLCTIQADLMTEEEELAETEAGELRFDLRLLGRRIAAVRDWIGRQPHLRSLPVGYIGTETGAAATFFAASERPNLVQAIVSDGGRPDLAGPQMWPWMWNVQVPVLFVVGSKDTAALRFTTPFVAPLPSVADRTLAVVEGARQLFTEEAALTKTASLARNWFRGYLHGA
jgi:putative phosphoribosyl transferase